MADTNNVADAPQTPESQPTQQAAQTPPPVSSTPVTAPAHSTEAHHSHTAIYVTLGIVGVLAVIAIFWSAFAYFSPVGAWSPAPGMMSDYQYQRAERNIDKAWDDYSNAKEHDTSSGTVTVPTGNYITVDQAIETARAKVGQDSVYGVEFDEENGQAVYIVDLNSGTTLYEVVINATTGDVLDTESAPLDTSN